MAVAAAMHDGVISATPPVGLRADPLGRAVAVRPMLHAALSLPDAAWSLVKAERQHLNKVADNPNLALALTLALSLTLALVLTLALSLTLALALALALSALAHALPLTLALTLTPDPNH